MSSKPVISRIATLEGPRDLRWHEQTLDLATLGPNEIFARTLVSTISPGTELAAWRGDPPLRPMKVYPRVVGYCNVARVEKVGQVVKSIQPGDLVLNYQSHRSAFITPSDKIAGALKQDADPVTASTAYLFHLGYNAILRSDVKAGMSVAVTGLGVLGLGAVCLAARAGARVFAFSNQEAGRKRALAFGADEALNKTDIDAAKEIVNEITGGTGVDVVISTSNSWHDWFFCLELARLGAKIAVLGFPGRGQEKPTGNPLDSRWFYDKQLTYIACGFSPDLKASPFDLRFSRDHNMKWLMDLLDSGDLPGGELVSETIPASGLPDAYRRLDAREEGLLTFALDWSVEDSDLV